jgi:hypothetical protein
MAADAQASCNALHAVGETALAVVEHTTEAGFSRAAGLEGSTIGLFALTGSSAG